MTPHPTRPCHRDRSRQRYAEVERLLDLLPGAPEEQRHALEAEVVQLTLDLPDAIARRFRGRGAELDDLVQVARLGLLKAVRGFRTGAGSSFPSYAVPTICGELRRHLRDTAWQVRPPRGVQELGAVVAAHEEDLRHELGRDPTRQEVASAAGLSAEDVDAARLAHSCSHRVSLDAVRHDGRTMVEPAHDPIADLVEHVTLRQAVGRLPDPDRVLVQLRYVEERTQREIAGTLGVSQMQVSRLLGSVTGRLRRWLEPARV